MKLLGKGAECRCYLLSPRRVLKLYRSEHSRDLAMRRQQRAHTLGIAPSVHGTRDHLIQVREGLFQFGYVSARARLARGLQTPDQVTIAMRRLRFSTRDIGCFNNPGNLGIWKRHPVVIDFGCLTVGG